MKKKVNSLLSKKKKNVNSLLTGQCGNDPYIYNMIFALHPY